MQANATGGAELNAGAVSASFTGRVIMHCDPKPETPSWEIDMSVPKIDLLNAVVMTDVSFTAAATIDAEAPDHTDEDPKYQLKGFAKGSVSVGGKVGVQGKAVQSSTLT